MAITYTEEQRELVKLVRDVARNEVMPHVAAADKAGECPASCTSGASIWDCTWWRSPSSSAAWA